MKKSGRLGLRPGISGPVHWGAGIPQRLHPIPKALSNIWPGSLPPWCRQTVRSGPLTPTGHLRRQRRGNSTGSPAVLPQGRENGTWLIFEIANLEAAVFLDGQELLCSSSLQDAGTVNMGQVYLPLPGEAGRP